MSRLARTFPAQIEALNRHRSHDRSLGEPVITVQNVSVGDGGNAIVGNVTQHHAHVTVPDQRPAAAATEAAAGPDIGSVRTGARRPWTPG